MNATKKRKMKQNTETNEPPIKIERSDSYEFVITDDLLCEEDINFFKYTTEESNLDEIKEKLKNTIKPRFKMQVDIIEFPCFMFNPELVKKTPETLSNY